MPETTEQFAARIKSKYPDYATVPDAELVNRVLDKHPEYRSQVENADRRQSVTTPSPAPSETIAHRAGRYAGELLPAAGMTLGGAAAALAGPEAIPFGAALGGAGGEALRSLLPYPGNEAPVTPQGAAKGIATQGTIGLATELAGPILDSAASGLKNSAVKGYDAVLNATTRVNKAKAAKVIPELIDRGVIAGSRKGLENQLAAKAAQSGAEVGATEQAMIAAENAGTAARNIDSTEIMKSLDAYRDKMLVPGTRIPVIGNEAGLRAADEQIGKLQELIANQGQYLSKESTIGLKRILDEQVVASKQGAYLGQDMAQKSTAKAQKAFANALRKELADKAPDFAKVNAEYSFWRNGLDVIKATNLRKVGQSGIVDKVLGAGGAGTAGGAAGYLLTGNAREAAGAALALGALRKAMTTTAWRTTSAIAKNTIADLISKGQTKMAVQLLSRIGASEATQ